MTRKTATIYKDNIFIFLNVLRTGPERGLQRPRSLFIGPGVLYVRCRLDFLRRTFRQAFRNVTAGFSAAFLFYPIVIALPRHRLERP